MAGKKSTIGPTGETVANNIARLRESQNLTYAELSRRLAAAGQPIPELGLRNIEKLQRKIDVDELMALCWVLNASPTYMLSPQDGDSGTIHAVTALGERSNNDLREWLMSGRIQSVPEMSRARIRPEWVVREQDDSGKSDQLRDLVRAVADGKTSPRDGLLALFMSSIDEMRPTEDSIKRMLDDDRGDR